MKCDKCRKEISETKHTILGPGIDLWYCSDRCLKTYYNDGEYEEDYD